MFILLDVHPHLEILQELPVAYPGISIEGCEKFCDHTHFYRPRPLILSRHAHFEVCTIKNRTYYAADGIQDVMVSSY